MNEAATAAPHRGQKKILAIDDEVEVLKLYQCFLSFRNYDVKTTDKAETFLEELKNNPPDLLILDINLPDMSGLSLLEIIRANALTSSIPIIMVSARGDEDTIKEAIKLGCDNFVVKPFKMKDFQERIEAELYNLREEDIRDLLSKVKRTNNSLLKALSIPVIDIPIYDAYPIKYHGRELCVVTFRGVNPKSVGKHEMEQLSKEAMIFFKSPVKWRLLFPKDANIAKFSRYS
ncbi:MAG: response regulator transcription factor [Oligoflexales bacterium]|nr:response regulator transcription factor [Oligoflexales bacterium]